MIFKIQKPLSSSMSNPPALIYNKGLTCEFTLEVDANLGRLFDEHGPKVFVEGTASQEAPGKWALLISKVVPDPGW